jgi:predicted O-methyltransferase YrrM
MLESTTTPRLIKKAIRHPLRAARRLVESARYAQLDETEERNAAIAFLSSAFQTDVRSFLEKHERSGIRGWMERRMAQLNDFPGPYRLGATPAFDCETIYMLVRALQPDIVVETGVCYGASSAYILHALADNRRGVLYSIDLGNRPDEPPSDYFVPRHLMDRWHLIIGDVKQKLPRLLADLGRIDMFHHDSLHTYGHMMWEYGTAFPHVKGDGVLSSHDVRTIVDLGRPFRANPFSVFCERNRLRSVTSRNVGIAMRQPGFVRRPKVAPLAAFTDATPLPARARARAGSRRH